MMPVKVPLRLRSLCIKALCESMETRVMTHMIRDIFPDYDIFQRTGFPESLSIPNVDVAKQIVRDVVERDRFALFVALLIRVQEEGYMGRRYPIAYLRQIVQGTYELGYIYDSVNKLFAEDPKTCLTRNWGVLQLGKEYTIAFMSIDIAGNSQLVRSYPEKVIQDTYKDLREIVQNSTHRRNGRIWNWEGDGGVAAFFFGNKHMNATLTAMEILHEVFIYNKTRCAIKEQLNIRLGVHGGPCEYTDNEEQLKKLQTLKEVFALEQASGKNSLTISIVIKLMLEEIISRRFKSVGKGKNGPFTYSLVLE